MGDVQLLAAMLRSDQTEVASYARVLSGALAQALPPGMVETEYQRSVSDRLAGRPGRAVRLVVHGNKRDLELREAKNGQIDAEVRQVVHGVTISRRSIGMDDWLQALAHDLAQVAARDSAAREALQRLLHG
ncbi:MAG: hypothetical protein JO296_13865 [Pseudonocardiales bacterium]|nr:hypothetical protein [Pseudonocardiales bacterium]MBV9651206.1 hypothetical protein [Pseudonocardiales bacterium]